jgi:hypothetical protein
MSLAELETAVNANDFMKSAVLGMELAETAVKNGEYQIAIEIMEVVNLSLQLANKRLHEIAKSLEV